MFLQSKLLFNVNIEECCMSYYMSYSCHVKVENTCIYIDVYVYCLSQIYRQMGIGSCYKTIFFACQHFSWFFLLQVLYHKSRGREEECIPGFSFKIHDCKILKSNFSLYMQAVQKECIARCRKGSSLVMRPECSTQHIDMVPL